MFRGISKKLCEYFTKRILRKNRFNGKRQVNSEHITKMGEDIVSIRSDTTLTHKCQNHLI